MNYLLPVSSSIGPCSISLGGWEHNERGRNEVHVCMFVSVMRGDFFYREGEKEDLTIEPAVKRYAR